jgi:hypothetical protein
MGVANAYSGDCNKLSINEEQGSLALPRRDVSLLEEVFKGSSWGIGLDLNLF